MSPRLGLMLYTLRDECARDLEGTLRAVGEIGYAGVELHSCTGAIRPTCAASSTHTGSRPADDTRCSKRSRTTWMPWRANFERSVRTSSCWRGSRCRPPPRRRTPRCSHRRSRRTRARRWSPARLSQPRRRVRPLDDGRTVSTGWSSWTRSDSSSKSTSAGRGSLGRAGGACQASGAARAARPCQGLASAPEPHFVPVGEGGVGYADVLPALGGLGVEWLLVEQDEVDGSPFDAVRRSFAAVEAAVVGSVA